MSDTVVIYLALAEHYQCELWTGDEPVELDAQRSAVIFPQPFASR
ncbi:MAG: hypothetical protein KatS3mg081_0048 [Gemmatimonadales bacterium]|nr:MAG: hypothetical protein KatS3mg081_0048 [Gemmatimonadales bacterium]